MRSKYFYILVLVITSCQSPESNLYQLDPRRFNENTISLEEIAIDIRYIKLDNYYPIGIIYKYTVVNNLIYLSAKDIGILVFNREGKVLNKIGQIGRGPGEFRYGMDFAVDERTGNIYVFDYNKIVVYSRNGDLLREIFLRERASAIEFYNSKIFIGDFLENGDTKNNWIFLDTLGNIIKIKTNTIPSFPNNMGVGGGIYKFGNKICYYNYFNDTVFSILPDLNYQASFLFSTGEHRWPRSKLDVSQLSQYMHPILLFETNHYLVFYYFFKKYNIALIDKKSKKTFLTYLEREEGSTNKIGGILNNLDGGPMFQPQGYFVENDREYMVGLVHPYQLKAHIKNNKFSNSPSKYPEKKKELENLANSLKETDNPVLMLVRLKGEYYILKDQK